jgi:hypothetical protein
VGPRTRSALGLWRAIAIVSMREGRCPLWVKQPVRPMSALPPKADIAGRQADVRFVPILLQKAVEAFSGQ